MQLISHIHSESRNCFISLVAVFNKNRLINCFLGIFSAKQTTRPDSIITCCRQVVPYIKQSLAQECWKVFFISKRILHISEDTFLKNDVLAIEALNRLQNAIENNLENEVIFSGEEVQVIEKFFSKPISESLFFKLNAYLIFLGKEKLWKTLKASKEIFLPVQENCVEAIQKKMESVDKFLKQSVDSSFSEDSKLTPKDVRLLMVASARKKTLKVLNNFQISYPYSRKLYEQWSELEKLNDSGAAKHLRDLCMEGYTCGRVFFYDWSFIEIRDFHPFSFTEAIKHVLYSRIPHVAIVVKDSQNQTSLSHVNGATGTHAIHPIRFPILGALGNFVELDILPLMPSSVSLKHRNILQKHFSDTFIKLASEEHPNIVLEWKHLLTFFFGHKSLIANDLSKVNLSPKQSQLCSSYVGSIFLKAIHEVNLKLIVLGYTEKIRHPFGEHEIIDRVDIPRLLYHWKRLKVIKAVPVDVFVSKIFTTPILIQAESANF
jgi:hypothetical protein